MQQSTTRSMTWGHPATQGQSWTLSFHGSCWALKWPPLSLSPLAQLSHPKKTQTLHKLACSQLFQLRPCPAPCWNSSEARPPTPRRRPWQGRGSRTHSSRHSCLVLAASKNTWSDTSLRLTKQLRWPQKRPQTALASSLSVHSQERLQRLMRERSNEISSVLPPHENLPPAASKSTLP